MNEISALPSHTHTAWPPLSSPFCIGCSARLDLAILAADLVRSQGEEVVHG